MQRLLNHRDRRGVTDIYGERNIPDEAVAMWAQRVADKIAERLGLGPTTSSRLSPEVHGVEAINANQAASATREVHPVNL